MRIEVDYKAALAAIEKIRHDQIPFAASVALNKTAEDAQAVLRLRTQETFRLTRPWVLKGIRVGYSTKTRLEASVYTLDWFMKDQEEGSTRTSAGVGAEALTVPTEEVKRTKRGGISRARSARRMLLQPRTFVQDMDPAKIGEDGVAGGRRSKGKVSALARAKRLAARRHMRKPALVQRVGKSRYPIKVLYWLKSDVRILPKWRFTEIVERAVIDQWPHRFKAAAIAAMKSAR